MFNYKDFPVYFKGKQFFGKAHYVDGFNSESSIPDEGLLCAVIPCKGSPYGSCWDEDGRPNTITDAKGRPIILNLRKGTDVQINGYVRITYENVFADPSIKEQFGWNN